MGNITVPEHLKLGPKDGDADAARQLRRLVHRAQTGEKIDRSEAEKILANAGISRDEFTRLVSLGDCTERVV